MDVRVLSTSFLEAVRKYVEKELNYEYSWTAKDYVRKRDRSISDLSQKVLPFETVAEVTDFEDETYYGGYCKTCEYTKTHCRITYRLGTGEARTYEYEGSFASLINHIVDA
jgi:hypothetical protein